MEEERVISLKGIIIGAVVDFVGSMVVGFMVSAIYAANCVSSGGLTGAAAAEALQQCLMGSFSFLITCFASGLFLTMIGGYVAATIAKASELLNAGCVGVLGLMFTIIGDLISMAKAPSPGWYMAAALILTLPAALLGGYLRQKSAPQL